MVVGKDTFTERAELNANFDGFEAGIIVETEIGFEERDGTLLLKDEVLLGGWATVHRKDHDKPIKAKVSMIEYTQYSNKTAKPNKQWTKMPATMIRKVALVQALRESFPSDLGGCYDSSEMGAEI
jgi:phage recombination protein Bet